MGGKKVIRGVVLPRDEKRTHLLDERGKTAANPTPVQITPNIESGGRGKGEGGSCL